MLLFLKYFTDSLNIFTFTRYNNMDTSITKQKSLSRDLTSGSPMKLLIEFAFPLILGILLQQFYSLVDTMIVGRYLGKEALAGVGSTGPLNFIVLGFCMGICNGFSVIIAQAFGARDEHNLRKAVFNSIWLTLMFGIIVTVLTCIFCKQFLVLMNTPDSIIEYAETYIFIIFAGIPCMLLYNMSAAILRSLGDSRSPLLFLGIAAVLNIGLDLLFIAQFKANVEGAAYATVLAQGISGACCVVFIRKKYPILKPQESEVRIDSIMMKKLIHSGIPMGLQYSITGIGSVILQSSVNNLGDTSIAAMTTALKVHILLSCPLDGLGQAMAPFAGQNVGARRVERVGQGLRDALIISVVICTVLLALVLLFGRHAATIFLDKENLASEADTVIRLSRQYLVTVTAFDFLVAVVNTFRFSIQGMGFSNLAMIAGVMELIARALTAWILIPLFGFTGACFSSPIAWIFADAFLIPAFFICKRSIAKRQTE